MDGQAEFAKRYEEFADLQLIELAEAHANLTEPAGAALRAEFVRRKLGWPETKVVPVTKVLAASKYGKMSNRKLLEAARGYDGLSTVERQALRDRV